MYEVKVENVVDIPFFIIIAPFHGSGSVRLYISALEGRKQTALGVVVYTLF